MWWFNTLNINKAVSCANIYWCNLMKEYCLNRIVILYRTIDNIKHNNDNTNILIILSKIRKKLYYFNYILKSRITLSKTFLGEIGKILYDIKDRLDIIEEELK